MPGLPRFAIALLGWAVLDAAAAPLATRNEATLARFAALPPMAEARIAAPGSGAWRLQAELTNEFYLDRTAREFVRLDGETLHLTGEWRASLAPDWEWSLGLGVLHRGGGVLDRFIEDWHGWFGLPNGRREQAPQDEVRFFLERDGVTLLDERRSGATLADTRLMLAHALTEGRVWRVALTLPTGSASQLTGGAWGLASGVDQALPLPPGSRWQGQLGAGVAVQQRTGPLAGFQRAGALYGQAAAQWRAFGPLSLLGQVYLHTPLYRELENRAADPGLQLALGLRWAVAPGWALDLAFQEDPIIHASPDFSLLLALRRTGG